MDEGEAEAIVLAEGLWPDVLLIIDDRDGRRGLIDLAAALDRLGRTTFRVSPSLLRDLLERERRRRGES